MHSGERGEGDGEGGPQMGKGLWLSRVTHSGESGGDRQSGSLK